MAITERNLDIPRDLAVLAWNDQLYPSELILRQVIIENLKHTINAAIEFSFLRFRIIGTAHTMQQKSKHRV